MEMEVEIPVGVEAEVVFPENVKEYCSTEKNNRFK